MLPRDCAVYSGSVSPNPHVYIYMYTLHTTLALIYHYQVSAGTRFLGASIPTGNVHVTFQAAPVCHNFRRCY